MNEEIRIEIVAFPEPTVQVYDGRKPIGDHVLTEKELIEIQRKLSLDKIKKEESKLDHLKGQYMELRNGKLHAGQDPDHIDAEVIL